MSNQGLRGISAGRTSICTVGLEGKGLSYRGYDIQDLSKHCCFEEVAYLLLHDTLPNSTQLSDFQQTLINLRKMPQELKEVLEKIPTQANPMDVLRTTCSFLGNLEPETDFSEQIQKIYRMFSLFPYALNYWYHFSHHKKRISENSETNSIAGYFLNTLYGRPPTELETRVIDVSLILYAEHEFNASTFNARVCAATLSDIYSCIGSAIGTLRGSLHGGANEAAMEMLEKWNTVEQAQKEIYAMLGRKKKVMGFGHAVYKIQDPRNAIIKYWSEQLSKNKPDGIMYEISCEVEKILWKEKKLFANADFFHASAYHFLGIPTKLFTPIFVIARLSGWSAHVIEQRQDNKLIRPGAEYIGNPPMKFVHLKDRN